MKQNMVALERANDIRQKGCALRRRIAALPYDEGCEIVAAFLLDNDLPEHIDGMKLDYLLGSIHRVGSRVVDLLRTETEVRRRDVRVRDLTHYERGRLASALDRRARRYKPPKAA